MAAAQAKDNEFGVDEIFRVLDKGEDVMALVEGSPGIGKTTFSLKLAYDWANEKTDATLSFRKFELVLLLKCRDIDGDIMESIIEQLLPKDFEENIKKKLLDFIRDIYNQQKILIILDGLDELPTKSKHHVDELLHRRILPFCYVLVTSRQERGIDARKIFFFDILLEIEGFSENDASEYITKHFKNVGPGDLSKGDRLIEEIKKNTFLHALRKNPLNLLLLCVIFEDYEGELPSSNTKLYQIIIQCLLRRYRAKKGLKVPESDTDLDKLFQKDIRALGKVAWKCLLDDRHSFREDELKEMEKRNENLVARGLGLLYKEESLKRLKPQHEYCFLHKTFQEYLAASYIARKLRRKKFSVFQQLSFDDLVKKYPQVFLFVSGLLGEEASLLIEQIGKELKGDWDWHDCKRVAADFFINIFSESENGEQMADTLCSFIPFPLDGHIYDDCYNDNSYQFARVLGACKMFSKVQKPVKLYCDLSYPDDVKNFGDALESCSQLETYSINCREELTGELAEVLFERLSASTSLSQLTLKVHESISNDTAVMIGRAFAASKSLTQVTLAFPGMSGEAWLSALDTGLSADTPLTSAVLTISGPMNETEIQALERLLSNKSLLSLSLTVGGDMQDLLVDALSRGLSGHISVNSLDLWIYGRLSCYGAKSLERGLLENCSLNYLRVFVHGELPENWRTVVENVRLAKKSLVSPAFYCDFFSKVAANQLAHFRPFEVEEAFGPKQHLIVNVCGELTIDGVKSLCEVSWLSLSRLTINLYDKLTDGVVHLSMRCIDLNKTLTSVIVNIWGKLTEEEKTLSQHIIDNNPAITLNVRDVSVPPDDSSNHVDASVDNPASLVTFLTEAKNDRKEKLSLTVNIQRDTFKDETDHLFDVLAEDSTLKELTLTIHSDSYTSEDWGLGLVNGLRYNTSIRALSLTINDYGCFSGEWEEGLGKGLENNTTISALTLTINNYGDFDSSWGRGLGHGFAENRSLRTLTLTINNYSDMWGDWAGTLGDGLAKSKSLTTCNLTFNMHGEVNDYYLTKLCDNLMRSKSLTTLKLQVSDPQLGYDLSKVVVKSKSLSSIDLTVSFYQSKVNTSG